MNHLIKYLPYDINWYIATFIDDIDIRRKFNVYRKIDKNKFNFLNKIIRYSIFSPNGYKRYQLENLIENVDRSLTGVQNDMIEIFIKINENDVYREIHIFRLLQIPNEEYSGYRDIYYKGHLSETHYWKYIVISTKDD